MVRVLACQAKGRGFKSRFSRILSFSSSGQDSTLSRCRHEFNSRKRYFFVMILFFKKFKIYFVELKYLLLYNMFMFLLTLFFCYYNLNSILYLCSEFLLYNMNSTRFFFSNLTQIFYSYIKLSFHITFIICVPFHILSGILYVIPSLFKAEFRFLLTIFLSFISIYVVGFFFIYTFIIPNMLFIFLIFEKQNNFFPLHFDAKFDEYFQMILHFIFKLNIIFQIPLLLYCFEYFKIFTLNYFIKFRTLIYLFLIFLSAFLSPPEISMQFLYLFLMSFLFEIYIYFKLYKQYSWLLNYEKKYTPFKN